MISFDFNTNIIEQVINELTEAKSFIKIAIFQIHHQEIFNTLLQKLNGGVSVEIFTLPYDSINDEIKEIVTERFERLNTAGAVLNFCKWNVGDPERTTTAVGRWYSYHGKFLVTDRCAISLSANFTESQELDAILLYKDEQEKINEYLEIFNRLKELFIIPYNGFNGNLHDLIVNTALPHVSDVFQLPKIIESTTHQNTWVQHYPDILCPNVADLEEKLFITPFDGKARSFIENIIDSAEQFIYISTESFTDPDIPLKLKQKRLSGTEIFIISGVTSMDYQDRVNETLLELIACEVSIRTPNSDLEIHGKFIITENHLMVSSVNLNKINLGFKKTSSGQTYWRANTESITICKHPIALSLAKQRFLDWYNNSCIDVDEILTKNLEKELGHVFNSLYGLRSSNEVKKAFAIYVIKKKIEQQKNINKIIEITAKLMNFYHRNMVNLNDFVKAMILFFLSERKHDFTLLNEKLSLLNISIDINVLLVELISDGFIEQELDEYRINVTRLFI